MNEVSIAYPYVVSTSSLWKPDQKYHIPSGDDQMSIETRENTIRLQYDVKPQLLILRLAELQLEIVLAGRVPDLARDPI